MVLAMYRIDGPVASTCMVETCYDTDYCEFTISAGGTAEFKITRDFANSKI